MTQILDKFYMDEIDLESKDPMELFKSWIRDARKLKENMLAEKMTLATVRRGGGVSARTVILRGLDEEGFKMYWDSRSRKSQEVEEDPNAALVFMWFFRDDKDNIGNVQVRIEGTVERLTREEEVNYFNNEPIAAKIRAVVSHQSRSIVDRSILQSESQRILDLVKSDQLEIQKPEHYAGYRLRPTTMEFYKGSRDTINDRVKFTLINEGEDIPDGKEAGENGWVYERLEP